MEEASSLMGSIAVQPVPDITFAEADISVGHPAQLRWAERFGVKDGGGVVYNACYMRA